MNTQLNIKTRRQPFSPNVVTLLVLIVLVLVLAGPSAQAQSTTGSTATATDSGVVDSSITILAKGTVNDPSGAISVSGNVIVNCRRVIDTTASTTAVRAPLVLLDLDLSNLRGTSGSTKTTLVTYITGDNHATEIRPLQSSDTIIISTPYFDSTKSALSAKTMLVTATLNFDISTGKVTGGSITIGNNVVTPAMVGSATPAN
jgi:hypothetical protein